MNTFLVREALGYSEFVEALLLLYEDKQGVQQHEKNFDLPEELPRDDWQDWWHDATDEPEPDAAPTSPSRPTGAAAAISSPTRSTSAAAGGDGTGMSPTRQPPRAASFRSVGVLVLRCHLASRPPTSTSSAWRTVSSLGCYVVFDFYKLRG